MYVKYETTIVFLSQVDHTDVDNLVPNPCWVLNASKKKGMPALLDLPLPTNATLFCNTHMAQTLKVLGSNAPTLETQPPSAIVPTAAAYGS